MPALGAPALELDGLTVHTFESGESQHPGLRTTGYLITHTATGVSVLHTGDIHEPYEELSAFGGKVDFLIHMKLGLAEWEGEDISGRLRDLVRWVRPRSLVPIHYRTDRKSDPVPEGHW